MVCCDKVRRTEKPAASAASAAAKGAFELQQRRDRATAVVVHCASCQSECSLAEVLFNYCAYCTASNTTMPALPQGAFAACKIRSQESRKMPVAQVQPASKKQQQHEKAGSTGSTFPNWKLMDLSPLKYNSKFMDAIWGHYNRYSPHNMKSNDSARQPDRVAAQQQHQQ